MSKRILFLRLSLVMVLTTIFFSSFISSQCNDPIGFRVDEYRGVLGEEICFDIQVVGFTDVGSFLIPFSFNPQVLRYDHCENGPNFNFDCEFVNTDEKLERGVIQLFWNFNRAEPNITLADDDILVTLCFDVIGEIGNSTKVLPGSVPALGSLPSISMEIFKGDCLDIADADDDIVVGDFKVSCGSFDIGRSVCPSAVGSNNGSIKFSLCGGQGPYSYELIGAAATGSAEELEEVVIPNLGPGTYELRIQDRDDVTVALPGSSEIIIEEGTPVFITNIESLGPTCAAVTNPNGFIDVTAAGGTGPYSFKWSTIEVDINPLTEINAGDYALTVTDANGCSVEEDIVVDFNSIELVSINTTQASCSSNEDGTATINVTGGMPERRVGGALRYRVSINGERDRPLIMPIPLSNLATGQYNVMIFDQSSPALACSLEVNFEITALKDITLELTPSNDGCSAGGTMSVNARKEPLSLPLSSNLTYRILDETGMLVKDTSGSFTNFAFTGLPEGNFTVELTDGDDGCFYTNDDTIPPNTGEGIMITPQVRNPGCGQLGTITIDVPGDPADYTYVWSDGTTKVGDNTLIDLSPDNYVVTVTLTGTPCEGISEQLMLRDAGTALDFDDANSVRSNIQEIPCTGDPIGVLTFEIRDVSLRAGAVYTWMRDGVIMSGETSQTISGLGPGVYTLEISGADICTSTTSVTLVAPSALELTINQPDTVCFGSPVANFSAIVQNGNGAVNVTWQDTFTQVSLNGNNQFGAPVSTYLVSAFDPATNCRVDTFFTVEQYPEFNVQITNQINNICANDLIGVLEVAVTGGSGDGDIFYNWFTPTDTLPSMADFDMLTELASGIYSLEVFDNICAITEKETFEITGGDSIKIDLQTSVITSPSCFGSSDGIAAINISGGSGTLRTTRLLSDDQPTLFSFNGEPVVNVPAGEYRVQLVDDSQCSNFDMLSIAEPDLFTIEIDSANLQTLSCNSDNTGIIRTNINGGNAGMRTYSWSHDPTLNVPMATNLTPGDYTVYATDARGCQDSAVYVMDSNIPISLDFTSLDSVQCHGDRYMFGGLSPTGGTNNGFRFSLGGSLMPVSDSILVAAGTYDLEIRDQDGCVLDTIFTIMEPPEVVVELGPDIEIELGDTYQLSAEHDPEEAIISYNWDTPESINCLDCPTISVTPETDGVYGITIENTDGCADDDEVTIRVRRTRNVYIPNVIHTSKSDPNSSFKLFTGQGVDQIEYLRIFDRHGNMVHEVEQLSGSALGAADWDARLNGTLVESGVYVLMARVSFTDGQFLDYKGDITVIH